MSDAAAESRIYQAVWNAVYNLREAMSGERENCSWSSDLVHYVNQLIADLGWWFDCAQYFTPLLKSRYEGQEAKLWDAAFALRRALRGLNVGHDRMAGEREAGIAAGFLWAEMAAVIAVYEDFGISPGMQRAIERASDWRYSSLGVEIEHRRLPPHLMARVGEDPALWETLRYKGTPRICPGCRSLDGEHDFGPGCTLEDKP
jgi:hypothetical protein